MKHGDRDTMIIPIKHVKTSSLLFDKKWTWTDPAHARWSDGDRQIDSVGRTPAALAG
jgi:hypothetical protein